MGGLVPEVWEKFDSYAIGHVFPGTPSKAFNAAYPWQVNDDDTSNGFGFYDATWEVVDSGDPALGKVVSATDIPSKQQQSVDTYTSHLFYTGTTEHIKAGVIPRDAHYYVEVLIHVKEHSPYYYFGEHILQGVVVPGFNLETLIHTPWDQSYTPDQVANTTWGQVLFANGPYKTYFSLDGTLVGGEWTNYGRGITNRYGNKGWGWWGRVGLDIDLKTQMVCTYFNGDKVGGPTYVPEIKTKALDPGYPIYTDIEVVQNRADFDDFRIYLLPPVRSNGEPTDALPLGSRTANLSLSTDRNCECRYSTVPGVPFEAMTNTFSNTGGTAHSTAVSGLSDYQNYRFYVRSRTGYGVANTDDYVIDFPVGPDAVQTTGGFVKNNAWNLVSIPVDPVNPDPLSVFAGIDIANGSFQFWRNNVDGGGTQLYGAVHGWTGPLERGAAYWFINTGAGGDKDIHYQGRAAAGDFELTIPPHGSAPFWIMFGTPFASPVPAESLTFRNTFVSPDAKGWAEAYVLKMVESSAIGFDSAARGLFTVGPPSAFPHRTSLDPWMGYWLLVTRPEQLVIRFPLPR